MKRVVFAGALVAGMMLAAPLFAQSKAKAQNVPEIAFDSVPNLLKFPPGLYLGEGIGVATNSKGHIFVYTRSGLSSRLFEFDPHGLYIREIGHDLYGFQMAHAVRVDPQDNIWVVDEGTDLQLKEFGSAHEIDCRSENELYVAEITNWRVQKLALHPAKTQPSQK